MPQESRPLKYSGNYEAFLKRFEPLERYAVDNLRESCERHGAQAEKILESFAGIPLAVMENLSEEFRKNPARRSPNLDLMLFRDPAAVYPVYHAFAKHKFILERNLSNQQAGKKADQCVRDARAESAKYYKQFGQPELAQKKGEVQPVPPWARLRFWINGLPTDFANNAFVNEFLRTLKEGHQYRLKDRQNVLFALKPKGWPSVSFKDRISKAFQNPTGEKLGQPVYSSLSHEGTLEAQLLHHMLMASPEKVKFTHARVYQTHATRRLAYRLASFVESAARRLGQTKLTKKMEDWKKKMDDAIDEHILKTDSAIDQYHETFHRDYQIRVDASMKTPKRQVE